MVWCNHCAKNFPEARIDAFVGHCDLWGRILENFNFSSQVTFIKNAAGHSQASGNIVRSVESGISSSRARRIRIARDEIMNLKDALGIGDENSYVVDMAVRFFTLRVRFCELLYLVDNPNYEELVDPSIFIPRFTNCLLKAAHDKAKNVVQTAKDIIASMKRDWMQGNIVHMCDATITKRLSGFANTEAASLTVDELTERERIFHESTFTARPDSDKGEVICKHKDLKTFWLWIM